MLGSVGGITEVVDNVILSSFAVQEDSQRIFERDIAGCSLRGVGDNDAGVDEHIIVSEERVDSYSIALVVVNVGAKAVATIIGIRRLGNVIRELRLEEVSLAKVTVPLHEIS